MTELERLVRRQYEHDAIVGCYIDNARHLGLWESEKVVTAQFLDPLKPVLDIGCGAGRVTFGMYELGFYDITGLDASEKMIAACREDAAALHYPMEFVWGDACAMPFADETFESCVFSFNGLMTIPHRKKRRMALEEIARVLTPTGVFLFTTHLRGEDGEFWQEEMESWQKGKQDSRLNEFGDLVFPDTISEIPVDGFIHVPTRDEVLEDLFRAGLQAVYIRARSDIVTESPAVAAQTNNCVFWVATKTG